MNCREYQDDLALRAQNDVAARQTTEMLRVRQGPQQEPGDLWLLGTHGFGGLPGLPSGCTPLFKGVRCGAVGRVWVGEPSDTE